MKAKLLSLLIMISAAFTLQAQTESEGYNESEVILQSPDTTVTITTKSARKGPGPTTTPVDVDDDKPLTVLHYYDKHGEPLQEPVRFLATLDTVQKVRSKPVYPLYNGMNFGVNIGDLIFNAFGQRYGSYDVWGKVSLFNWIFPTLELGLGYANATPAHQNYTYKVNPSLFAKIGLDYNFLYKSNPDYQVFLGLRAGVTSFSYSLLNIDISSDYWEESQKFNMKGLKSTSFFGEALVGIQVKIVRNFSLGWDLRWHFNLHTSKDSGNKPWFIPGFGGSSPASVHVSAVWTIPGPKPPKEEEE